MSYYDNICSRERFAKDTATHQMKVIRDDGVYRHLRFKRPDCSAYRFDLVTWPGYLAITGDMGANMFSRVNDMFDFFRTDRQQGRLKINPGYWQEKLRCNGERVGATEFDQDKFIRVINEYRCNWMRDMKRLGRSKEDRRELWEDVECDVIDKLDDGKDYATMAAYEFRRHGYQFDDLFEHSFTKFTFNYIWRCRAIAWAIEQYDIHTGVTP